MYEIRHVPIEINDSPRYAYRGIMIDSSRHFHSLKVMKDTLVAMALAKINVLHWHIVDDDAFPLFLSAFPNLSLNAAFSES